MRAVIGCVLVKCVCQTSGAETYLLGQYVRAYAVNCIITVKPVLSKTVLSSPGSSTRLVPVASWTPQVGVEEWGVRHMSEERGVVGVRSDTGVLEER